MCAKDIVAQSTKLNGRCRGKSEVKVAIHQKFKNQSKPLCFFCLPIIYVVATISVICQESAHN